MKTEITLEQLERMINAHIESGGVVIDTYRDRGADIVAHALYVKDDYGARIHLSCKGCRMVSGKTIPESDILEAEGHEVGYTPNSHFGGYLGKITFLNPAPVDLCPRDDAGRAARIAYAAAICDYDDAVEAAEANADADDRAAVAAVAAVAAAYDAKAAYEAAAAAVDAARDALAAARAASHAATV
jgi:hypothetical protein